MDPIGQTARLLGDALERVVRLADGSLAAILADGAAVPAEASAMPLLPASAAAAMAVLGDASPLARADVVYEKPAAAATRVPAAWRTAALAAAARKNEAARVLRNAGQPSEALPLVHACLVLLCRAAAEVDPGEEPAALLAAVYGKLVPEGALTTSDAHALSRAAELSRAFAASPVPAPDSVVVPLFSDVADLVARVETRLTARAADERAAVLQSPEIRGRDRIATERSAVGSAI